MTAPGALRFFAVVIRPSAAILSSSVAIALAAIYWALNDPIEFAQACLFALFLQMFSAATGYRDRIRRGHFDSVLTPHRQRLHVAAAHCAVSMAPGGGLWAVLACIDFILIRQGWPTTLTLSGVAAFLTVSVFAWTVGVAVGRYSAGALWIGGLFVLGSIGRLQQLRYSFLTADTSWMSAVRQAGTSLVCPLVLLTDPAAATVRALFLLSLAVCAVWVIGATLIVWCDAPLEERA
jgi:hypothetical protein